MSVTDTIGVKTATNGTRRVPDRPGGRRVGVALLTGGGDRPYAYGLSTALLARDVRLDIIGGDDLDSPEFHGPAHVRFLNLRGDQRNDAGAARKALRVLAYHGRLIRYAWSAEPRIFHILWHNKFDLLDRTLVMLYYRALGRTLVFTAHNVNAGARDANDSRLNRLGLKTQYRLADHIFVHTEKMKAELTEQFRVNPSRVTVIPFGINNAVPITDLSQAEARRRLGIPPTGKVILFFGTIARYKGLDWLARAFRQLAESGEPYHLVVAGRPRSDAREYWKSVLETLREAPDQSRVLVRDEYIRDEDTEVYFKAADVLALPYEEIFQSGVLFLAYSFGLPVVAADVGALKEDVVEGRTGFTCAPKDTAALALALVRYFTSDLYRELPERRPGIIQYALARHSWDTVADKTLDVYRGLLESRRTGEAPAASA